MAYLQTITKPKTVGWLSQKLAEQDTRIKELEEVQSRLKTALRDCRDLPALQSERRLMGLVREIAERALAGEETNQ